MCNKGIIAIKMAFNTTCKPGKKQKTDSSKRTKVACFFNPVVAVKTFGAKAIGCCTLEPEYYKE